MDQIKIGNFIKELRKEQNLTQEELAEKFNVARRTVSRWETGSNMPDLDILVEMADFYDVDLREILDGERKSEKMYEELLLKEEGLKETANKMIYIGKPLEFDEQIFEKQLKNLENASLEEAENIRELLKEMVPTYNFTQAENKEV